MKSLLLVFLVFVLTACNEPAETTSAEECKTDPGNILVGCWVLEECTNTTPTSYKPGIAFASDGTVSASFRQYYDAPNCVSRNGYALAPGTGVYSSGGAFLNVNGLQVTQFNHFLWRWVTPDLYEMVSEKVTYYYFDGNRLCFPENSFMTYEDPNSSSILSTYTEFDELAYPVDTTTCYNRVMNF